LKVKEMKPSKRKKAQMALMFLPEKRDKSVNGRMVYNGKPTRVWLSRKDAASPMAALESIMITGVIEAKEERDIMTCDIPNAFIQALLPKKDPGEDRVIMKITGVLVNMVVDINPELYGPAERRLILDLSRFHFLLPFLFYYKHVKAYTFVEVLPCPTQNVLPKPELETGLCPNFRNRLCPSPNKKCNDDEYFNTTTQQPTRHVLSPKSNALEGKTLLCVARMHPSPPKKSNHAFHPSSLASSTHQQDVQRMR
jgi:hypothetical protein